MAKRHTLARTNTHGARRIPANATCITTSPIVSSRSPALPISHFLVLAQRCGCNLLSWLGRAQRSIRWSLIRETMASGLWVTKSPIQVPASTTTSMRCITRTSIGRSNPSVCLWALAPTSVTPDFMRHRKNPAGQTTARLTTRVTAANSGVSLRPAILSLGTAKPLRRIRTPTRFAGAHCIISGSTPINRRRLPMRQSATSRQDRP